MSDGYGANSTIEKIWNKALSKILLLKAIAVSKHSHTPLEIDLPLACDFFWGSSESKSDPISSIAISSCSTARPKLYLKTLKFSK